MSPKRYLGRVCEKHPELQGERYASSRGCVMCSREQQHTPEAKKRNRARQQTPKGKEYRRARNLRHNYGMSQQQWDTKFERQGRACACCGTTNNNPLGQHFDTDHDHVAEKGQGGLIVRGILCHPCNVAVGNVRNSSDIARKLVAYLETYGL